jgi:hypothetical protein
MGKARELDIVAAFPDERHARSAVDSLTRRGVRTSHLRLVTPTSKDPTRVGEMQAEMQEEVIEGVGGPGVGFMTPGQARGAISGAMAGGFFGLVVGMIGGAMWAWFGASAISPNGRLAIVAVSFMVAGGTIGLIAGGALRPRAEGRSKPGDMLDERRLAGERDTLVAVHVTDEEEAHVAEEVLKYAGATRIDALDDEGTPLPPQHEHPRPADLPGLFWSGNGRKHG